MQPKNQGTGKKNNMRCPKDHRLPSASAYAKMQYMNRTMFRCVPTAIALAFLAAGGLRADEPARPIITAFDLQPATTPSLNLAAYTVAAHDTGDASLEYRCRFRGRHFLSVLRDLQGGFAVRPHPGADENGWGTTLYVHPALSGVARIESRLGEVLALPAGITVTASGTLRNGAGVSKGDWSVSLHFTFDPEAKKITGDGNLCITRNQPLAAGEDIDVVKFASNYLHNVPLLTGGFGDTGDTTGAHYSGSALTPQFWNPVSQSGHYPQDCNDWLDITLPGCHNRIDTARQPDPNHPGQTIEPIAAAFKPSVRLRMELQQAGQQVPFIFGAAYALAVAQDFAADNVSVTPQIRTFAEPSRFDFTLLFESAALAEDHVRPDAGLTAHHESEATTLGVYHSPALFPPDWQRIGSLKRRANDSFSATLKTPAGTPGFLRADAENGKR